MVLRRGGHDRGVLLRRHAMDGGDAGPRALRAIAPFVTTDQYYEGWAYQGGAFQLGLQLALDAVVPGPGRGCARRMARARPPGGLRRAGRRRRRTTTSCSCHLPLRGLAELQGIRARTTTTGSTTRPTTTSGGPPRPGSRSGRLPSPPSTWAAGTTCSSRGPWPTTAGMKQHGGSEEARQHQRLVIGPWAHGPLTGWFPSGRYRAMARHRRRRHHRASAALVRLAAQGRRPGLAAEKPVRLFVMGANEWRDEDDWPLPGTRLRRLLPAQRRPGQHGRTVTAALDRRARRRARRRLPLRPRRPGPDDGRRHVPARAVDRGQRRAPDQRRRRGPADVLCYTTEPLGRAGRGHRPGDAVLQCLLVRPRHRLHRQAGRRGARRAGGDLADGILRARYRESLSEPRCSSRARCTR